MWKIALDTVNSLSEVVNFFLASNTVLDQVGIR